MDPYIERPTWWPGFHNALAAEIMAFLNPRLLPRYFARNTPYVAYEFIGSEGQRRVWPDLGVVQRQTAGGTATAGVATLTPAPVISSVEMDEPVTLFRVEILTTAGEQLVGVIEILSPSNKRHGHNSREEYLEKRRTLLRSPVHLIELDLLRGGTRPPLEEPVPAAPYYAVVSRAIDRPQVLVWPISLRDRLPALPVPLRHPDPDAELDLGAAVASVYERGAYGAQIDYRQPPPPPELSAEESAWVEELLAEFRKA
jgi:hypothetical protein